MKCTMTRKRSQRCSSRLFSFFYTGRLLYSTLLDSLYSTQFLLNFYSTQLLFYSTLLNFYSTSTPPSSYSTLLHSTQLLLYSTLLLHDSVKHQLCTDPPRRFHRGACGCFAFFAPPLVKTLILQISKASVWLRTT